MLLTQCCHLFGQVSAKTAKKVAAGQQVKVGVASDGVEGEWIHGSGVAGHVPHLLLPVGRHARKCC